MPRKVIVGGALVYDKVTKFEDSFNNHLLANNNRINVSFTVASLMSSWGGTGGNISIYLKRLGLEPLLVSAIGPDGMAYLKHLNEAGINTRFVIKNACMLSATCLLITDEGNNQINIYYPGPSDLASTITMDSVKRAHKDVRLAIISPSTRDVMLKQLLECDALRIETIIFDPGQQITSFGRGDLRQAIDAAHIIFCNDYEIELLTDHSGWRKEDILAKGMTLVTTYGRRGSVIENAWFGRIEVPAIAGIKVKDPTGAGDAYRAGFILGYERGYAPKICCQLGSTAASFVVEVAGTQEHTFDFPKFIERYEESYGPFPAPLGVEWRLGYSIV